MSALIKSQECTINQAGITAHLITPLRQQVQPKRWREVRCLHWRLFPQWRAGQFVRTWKTKFATHGPTNSSSMTHYTIKQLSERVGITEAQIRRHVKNKYLKAEKIPGAKG